jgi:5-methylcytosine-specific restriction enzyme A
MAAKPLRPCSKMGCHNLTRDKYCDTHKVEQDKQKQESNQHYNRYSRDKKLTDFYWSAAWRKLRAFAYARDNGLCVRCRQEKRLRKGDVVDHIVPVKEDWSKRLDADNLQTLCHACHNKKTGKEKQ